MRPNGHILSMIYSSIKLVLEEIFHFLVGNHLLIKDVSTSLGALHHLDDL